MLPKQPKNIRAGLDFSLGSVHGLVIDYMLRQTHSGDDNLLFKHVENSIWLLLCQKPLVEKNHIFLAEYFNAVHLKEANLRNFGFKFFQFFFNGANQLDGRIRVA